jgi:hypothetical protein
MQIAGDDFLVPRIGEQPDVSGQLAALDSGSDPVEAARQPAQQRHQLEHFLDSHVLQVHRSELSGDLGVRKALRLADDVEPGCLEVGCLAQLGFASLFLRSFATTQRRCREAIALAERHGWGAEPVIAPALIMLAATLVWTGEFDAAERWLQRTRQALQTDTGPDLTLLLHQTAGLLHAGRGRHHEALQEFGAAEHLASQLEGSQALAGRATRWRWPPRPGSG